MSLVMNKNFLLEKKSDGIGESQTEDKALGGAVYNPNYEKVSNSRVPNEVRVSLMELDPGAPESEFNAKMVGNGRSEEFRVFPPEEARFLASSDVEGRDTDMELKFSGSLVDVSIENSKADRFDSSVGQYGSLDDRRDSSFQYKTLLSEFDDYVANDKSGAMVAAATSRAISYGFEVGDLVWGKVKSHPWWPGHIFNDALASSSVRRTRREGYVLVAFFGDSSYGWFDPAELIPFDPNFYEKSRQTNSRTFLKAVEEAVDEASRRRSLGLACKCRNPYNFRHTKVEGYFAVDVPDFEAGGIYSWNQIKRARESFKPSETLSFIKQLALTPRGGDHRSINFLNNKATIFAFRRVVYEEFDETYAQAFGASSGRPTRNTVVAFEQLREPSRAPLSGPLVIAEALGGGKSAVKPMKLKDQFKKDKYLFKRRDELSNLKDVEIHQEQASSAVPFSLVGGSTVAGDAEEYVLLKRTPDVPIKPHILGEHNGSIGMNTDTSSVNIPSNEVEIGTLPVGINNVSQGYSMGIEAYSSKETISLGETKEKETVVLGESVGFINNACSDVASERAFPSMLQSESPGEKADAVGDVRYTEKADVLQSFGSASQPELSISVNLECDNVLDQALDGHVVPEPSPAGAKYSHWDTTIGQNNYVGVVKPKVLKRSLEDLGSDISVIGEKKKKKKKKETSPDHVNRQLVSKRSLVLTGKSDQVGLGYKEDLHWEHQKRVHASSNSVAHSGMLPVFGSGYDEFDVPQLLVDLQACALDPFHGVETNCDDVVQKFFLRFRSLVYQKSLISSPPSEAESNELRAVKSPDFSLNADNLSDHVRDLSSSNMAKPLLRRDDPTKAGRKRIPSDRLEEIAAKKLKKISDLKLLASEKKAVQKLSDSQRRESKEPVLPTTSKIVKRDYVKKLETPVKNPTMLVMKFPPQTSLPSLNELKARFGRFGPIDQSGLRVFWKTLTCRVVFLFKPDAEAAYKYAVGNKSLFGNVNVKYYIREVEAPTAEASELFEKGGGDDNPSEAPRLKDPAVLQGRASTPSHQPLPQLPLPAVQLKSCLKKSSGDEPGVPIASTSGGGGGGGGPGVGGSSKGTARVKFMLGGEESIKGGEQLMIGNRNNINANIADGGTPSLSSSSLSSSSSSSVTMDINSNFFQKVVSQSHPLPPILPLPIQFTKAVPNSITTNMHHSDIPPRNLHHTSAPPTPSPSISAPIPIPKPTPTLTPINPSATTIDISQQMLTLLTRCSDVVTNVTGLLGYVPYHPL